MEAGETVLLSETISLYPGKVKQNISVTNIRVIMRNPEHSEKEVQEIVHLKDVIGCHVLQEKKRPSTAYLCIFSYPLKKKRFGSGIIRQRVTRTLAMNVGGTFHENLMLAETWKITIKRLIGGEIIKSKQDLDNGSLTTRNLLVLVNPFSGRKKAMMMYKEKVKPMFTEAEIKHTVMTTEYPGHAKEMAKELKIKDWDGIVTVSGDGLIHEVINGLMDREDWEEAIKIPIGVVPGGSGNALAAAVVYASTGLHNVASSATICTFEVCRGTVSCLDLVGVELSSAQWRNNLGCSDMHLSASANTTNSKVEIYSFMDVALGLIADIDIESETLRCLGGDMRTVIYAVMRIFFLRKYKLQVSYLPAGVDENPPISCSSHMKSTEDSVKECSSNLKHAHGEPHALTLLDNDNHAGEKKSISEVPSKHKFNLPPIDADVPKNWVTVEKNFLMVMANYISHISHDSLIQKHSELDDGRMFLYLLDESASRCSMFKAWDKMADGSGVSNEVNPGESIGNTVLCTAFRIVPKSTRNTILTVDGEVVPRGTIQCRILPGLARVMTSRGCPCQ